MDMVVMLEVPWEWPVQDCKLGRLQTAVHGPCKHVNLHVAARFLLVIVALKPRRRAYSPSRMRDLKPHSLIYCLYERS